SKRANSPPCAPWWWALSALWAASASAWLLWSRLTFDGQDSTKWKSHSRWKWSSGAWQAKTSSGFWQQNSPNRRRGVAAQAGGFAQGLAQCHTSQPSASPATARLPGRRALLLTPAEHAEAELLKPRRKRKPRDSAQQARLAAPRSIANRCRYRPGHAIDR